MLTVREYAAGLTGLGRLLRLRPDAFECFDATPTGFWRSMRLAIILYPAWLGLLFDRIGEVAPPDPTHFAIMQSIGYVIGWFAYPLLMVRLCRFLDRSDRFYTFIVTYNWFVVVAVGAQLVLTLLHAILPTGFLALIELIAGSLLLVYTWFIIRRGLLVANGTAIALVLIEELLGRLIEVLAGG